MSHLSFVEGLSLYIQAIQLSLKMYAHTLIHVKAPYFIIMPRCACVAKHTVVTLCVCVFVPSVSARRLCAKVSVSTDIIPCFLSL